MTRPQLLEVIQGLSRAEKLLLLEEIWDDLDMKEGEPIPEWHEEILERRLAEAEAEGAKVFESWDVVKASILRDT